MGTVPVLVPEGDWGHDLAELQEVVAARRLAAETYTLRQTHVVLAGVATIIIRAVAVFDHRRATLGQGAAFDPQTLSDVVAGTIETVCEEFNLVQYAKEDQALLEHTSITDIAALVQRQDRWDLPPGAGRLVLTVVARLQVLPGTHNNRAGCFTVGHRYSDIGNELDELYKTSADTYTADERRCLKNLANILLSLGRQCVTYA